MVNVTFAYWSDLTIQDCIIQLTQPPLHFRWGLLFARDYEIESICKNELVIIFTKGYNLSSHRTKYHVTFYEQGGKTYITLKFISEQGGFLFPFVTDWEISKLLEQRVGAKIVR